MKATNLKLPDDLQQRIAQLVEGTGRTAHSFMIDAIEQAARREELRRRTGAEADQWAKKIGKVCDAAEAFRYFESRAKGERAKRPQLKSLRRSG